MKDNRVFILNDLAIKQELLKAHYNDPLAEHFNADRTAELLRRKYF